MAFIKNFQHDVFISYAHVDNSEDAGDQHWISQFKRKLHAALTQRLGGSEDLAIFFADTSLNSNQQLDELLSAAGNSALFLAIASPSYAVRDWTKKELDAFMATRPDLERLFAVECLPLDKGKTYPAPLQTHKRLKFWRRDTHSDTPMPLSPASDAVEFNRLIQQLAMQIQQQLEKLAENQPDEPVSGSKQPTSGAPEPRKTYVPTFRHDVLVSYAAADENWSIELSDYLQKLLKQKLATADGFQITTAADPGDIDTAATLLIVASPAYFHQYQARLEQSGGLTKEKPVFLVEYEAGKRPEILKGLKGLSSYKFWDYDETEGSMPLTGDAYVSVAEKLVTAIADRLKVLKEQQEHLQRLEQQRAQQQQNRTQQNVDAFVFLHSALEDLNLTEEIVPLLIKNGIDYVLPIKRSAQVLASEIRQDIENNILNCDAILILYEQTTLIWAREQLSICRRLERKREKPLKVIAVHKAQDKPDLDIQLSNLQIYRCPPEQINTYLPRFIEALL